MMYKISFGLWLFVAAGANVASAASVVSTTSTKTTTTTSTVTYPSLIECVCNTTLASAAVVKTSTPSCIDDVFAVTGIRWYLNGPLLPDVKYWHQPPTNYSTGRAALRLLRLGYRCSRVQLYDATDPYY